MYFVLTGKKLSAFHCGKIEDNHGHTCYFESVKYKENK